jgi:hypothetical protein
VENSPWQPAVVVRDLDELAGRFREAHHLDGRANQDGRANNEVEDEYGVVARSNAG